MTQDEWDWNDDDQEQPDQEEELDPETGRKVTMAMQRLRNFQYDLADDMVMTRIKRSCTGAVRMQQLTLSLSMVAAGCLLTI